MNPDRFSHAELRDRLPAYAADALVAEEREAVARHLAGCAACRAELEEMRLLIGALDAKRHRPIAGPSIADAVMARIASSSPISLARPLSVSQEDYSMNSHATPSSGRERATATFTPLPSARRVPRRSDERRRQSRPLVAAAALLAVAGLLAALLMSRLAPSGPGIPPSSVGDWRAAYLGTDGGLHIVSSGGTSAAAQIPLPGANPRGLPMPPRAGESADGRYLAYIQETPSTQGTPPMWVGSGPVTVVDISSGRVTTLDLMATEIQWAPDAPRFISLLTTLGNGGTTHVSLTLTDVRTNQRQDIQLVPALERSRVTRLVGWIDAHHVAVVADPGGKGVTVPLISLDLATGGMTTLATLVQPPDVFLSPDGKRAFVAPNFWAPSARIVDTTTGATTELPGITAAFAGRLKHVDNLNLVYGGNWAYQWAWRPGTHTIALSLSASSMPNEGETQPVTQVAGVWLIDLDRDQATSLNRDRYPLAWTPDGRTLFQSDIATPSTVTNTGYSVGPHLYALTPVTPGGGQALSGDMVAFFGLVRNG